MSKPSADLLRDATILLAGHGSSRPGAENPIHDHCQTLKLSGKYTAVLEGYLKQPPLLTDTLSQITSDALFVVPMLTGHGYITDELIPAALKSVSARVHMCQPIGCHPAMAALLADRMTAFIRAKDLTRKSVSVLLAAHGNRQNPANARQVNGLAHALSDLCDKIAVKAAFIEEAPLISDWPSDIKTENLIVLPFMIGGGRHGAEDVPTMIGLDPSHADLTIRAPVAGPFKLAGHVIWYCRAIGYDPALAPMIMDLVEEAS